MDRQARLGASVASFAASAIDPARVDAFLEQGEAAEGYRETEAQLKQIRGSAPDILYLYAYQFREDGIHVVFDLDTEELKGNEPGDVLPVEDALAPYLSSFLAGEEVEPIISNDRFGWLLMVSRL